MIVACFSYFDINQWGRDSEYRGCLYCTRPSECNDFYCGHPLFRREGEWRSFPRAPQRLGPRRCSKIQSTSECTIQKKQNSKMFPQTGPAIMFFSGPRCGSRRRSRLLHAANANKRAKTCCCKISFREK